MAALAHTLLLGFGIVSFLFSIPAFVTCWQRHSGFAQAVTRDAFTMSSPLLCAVVVFVGIAWMRATKKREPRRSPGRFTEEAGPDGGGDGGASD